MPFPPEATLGDVGEFGLIAELTPLFAQGEHVLVGPGDDAAVLRVRQGHVVVSTDLLIEGQHFRNDWVEAADVGHRAAAQNLSDINAMGGRAHSLTIGLGAPRDLPARWALDFAAGFAAECDLVGASVVGGDLTRCDQVVIAVTVIGACTQAPVLRSGAQPGDVLALAGRQGWSAGGLAVLTPRVPLAAGAGRGLPPPAAAVRRRAGRRRGRRHVDDRRLRRAAGRRRPPRRPTPGWRSTSAPTRWRSPEPLHAVAAATGADPVSFVLGGGEDHSLLATFPDGRGPGRLDGHRRGRRGRGRHRRRRGVRRRDGLDALLRPTRREHDEGRRPLAGLTASSVASRSVSAGDLARLEAAGADVEPLGRAVDRRADPLDVGVEATLGDLARPRPVVAEAGLLGADVADGGHCELLEMDVR